MPQLHHAAQAGDLKTIKTLKLFDINKRDIDGKTALFYASQNNHLDIVKYLLEHNGDPNVLNSGKENGPLLQASANGHTDMVDYLLQHGAAANLANNENRPPLSRASYNNRVDTVVCLIKHGANVNQTDDRKISPVWWGAYRGNMETVTHLVKAGADINIANVDQRTPISVASHEGHIEILSYLCKHGADFDIPMLDGRTPLFLACQNNHIEVVTHLVQTGANVDVADEKHRTPISVASQEGFIQIVSYFCIHGADVNSPMLDGRTPLFLACQTNHTNVVQCLLDHGADADVQNNYGNSSLHVSAGLGFKETVKLLLSHNVKVTNNNNGQNPLDLAKLVQNKPMPNCVRKTDFDNINSMLEDYEVRQKQENLDNKDAKNQIKKEKTKSCIIEKDLLDSPVLQNLAAQKAKAENEVAEMIRGKLKDENEYLKGLWAEINNVGKEISKPKKVKEDQGLSDQQLLTLAKQMEQDWKMIGGFLGVRHSDIKELAAEHKSEPTYAAWSMLVAWRDASGGGAGDTREGGAGEKRQQLVSVLVQMGRQDIVDLM